MNRFVSRHVHTVLLALTLSASVGQAAQGPTVHANAAQYQQWIEAMKDAERGPFTRIRWFCNDGRVLPPKAYACGEAGGLQHGQWSDQTLELREQGYKVANLLAGVDAQALMAEPDFIDSYNQMLIEKYLVAADDGWILRRAMFYRGAMQELSLIHI